MSGETFSVEDAMCIGETRAAILVKAPVFDTPQWVPRTQISDDSEVFEEGTEGTLVVSEWIASQKGWL